MSEPVKLIYKKMVAIAKDVGAVTKVGTNTSQGYKFRGIDQFVNALHPALIKHGVIMVPSASNVTTELREVTRANGKPGVDKHVSLQMMYGFYAEDGSSVIVGPIPAEGLDSGDKATNKALSAALKYALIQTFTVPTEDMAEADLESPEIVTKSVAASSPTKAAAASVGPDSQPMNTPSSAASTSASAPRRSTSFNRRAAPATNGVTKPPAQSATKVLDEWAD